MTFTRRQVFQAILATATVMLAPAAHAQSTLAGKTIKIVVPYPPGGPADQIARIYADQLAKGLNTTVIIDNKPGASGTIGAETVARAAADGTTLMVTVTTQLSNAAFNVKPSYNAVEDFAPIVGLAVTPLVLAIPASLGAKDMKEFAALAKNGKMAYGSYGTGTSTHVLQNLLAKQLGSDMVHVPYKGEAPMVTDMLGGQIQMGMMAPRAAREMENAGRMRAVGVVGPIRSEFLPNVPTFEELGYRELDWAYGVAVYTSSKVPAETLQLLERVSQEIVNNPDVQKRYRAQAIQPWNANAAELKKRLVSDTVRWAQVLAKHGSMN